MQPCSDSIQALASGWMKGGGGGGGGQEEEEGVGICCCNGYTVSPHALFASLWWREKACVALRDRWFEEDFFLVPGGRWGSQGGGGRKWMTRVRGRWKRIERNEQDWALGLKLTVGNSPTALYLLQSRWEAMCSDIVTVYSDNRCLIGSCWNWVSGTWCETMHIHYYNYFTAAKSKYCKPLILCVLIYYIYNSAYCT